MAEDSTFEGVAGFISCRTFGLKLMGALEDEFKAKHFDIGCWADIPGASLSHQTRAAGHILRSTFAIIITDASGFDNGGSKDPCAQLREVRHIWARMNTSGPPFRMWRIVLQSAPGTPRVRDIKNLAREDSWLLDHVDTRTIVAAADGTVPHKFAERLCTEVRLWIRRSREAPETPDGTSAKQSADLALDIHEISYLDRAMGTWIESISGATKQGSALDFRLARAVPLLGEDAEGTRRPLAHSLFDADARPLILRGGPGMGKRCALLSAAAVMAQRASNRFDEHFESEAAKAYLKDGERLGDTNFVPVVLQAERIARFVEGKSIKPEHVHAAIAAEMFDTPEPDRSQREAVAARMKTQPYALLIDGLETLRGAVKPRDLMTALTQMRIALEGVSLKVVATARVSVPGSDRAEIELQPLTDDLIDLFIEHFVWDLHPAAQDKAERERDRTTLRNARQGLRASVTDAVARGAVNEVLGTPLLLNAFCWTTLNRPGNFAERRTILSGELLNNIVSQDLHAPTSDVVLTPADQRELLQLLGLLVSDAGFGLEQARLAARAWLSKRPSIDTEDKFHEVLTLLAEHTSLFVEQSGVQFRFCTTFWPEQLAAEALAANPTLLQVLLGQAPAAKIAAQSRVFANTCALILNGNAEDRFDRSLDIPLAALDRAGNTGLSGEDVGSFVAVAAEVLAIAAPRVARDPRDEPNTRATDACNAVAARYKATWSRWTLRQRDVCLNDLARAARRHNAWEGAVRTSALFDKVLGADRWAEIKTERGAVVLATRPVLFAEYDAFVRAIAPGGESAAQVSRLFDHAEQSGGSGEAGEERIDDVMAILGARPAAPAQYVTWFEAVAYCRWLTERLRAASGPERLEPNEALRLPTVEEFQAVFIALAGAGNYPWGDQKEPAEGENACVNYRGSRIGHATAVGVFDAIRKPRLPPIWDFATNVQVWTTPSAVTRQSWWPVDVGAETAIDVVGASWATPYDELKQDAGEFTPPALRRSRQIGMRLVKVRVE